VARTSSVKLFFASFSKSRSFAGLPDCYVPVNVTCPVSKLIAKEAGVKPVAGSRSDYWISPAAPPS